MKLNQLSIEGNAEHEKKNNTMSIRAMTYYITEIFMHFLLKIDLDGSGKLVIYFYDRPDLEPQYECDKYFHVSWYNVDKSVIDKFAQLEKGEYDEFFLNIVVDVCKYIALSNNREELIEVIEQAAIKVRECNFELELLQKKLSKLSDNRRYKANVYRNVNRQGEIWYVVAEDKINKTSTRYEIMNSYSSISKTELFKKSYWEDEKFILADRFDRVVGSVEVKEI